MRIESKLNLLKMVELVELNEPESTYKSEGIKRFQIFKIPKSVKISV